MSCPRCPFSCPASWARNSPGTPCREHCKLSECIVRGITRPLSRSLARDTKGRACCTASAARRSTFGWLAQPAGWRLCSNRSRAVLPAPYFGQAGAKVQKRCQSLGSAFARTAFTRRPSGHHQLLAVRPHLQDCWWLQNAHRAVLSTGLEELLSNWAGWIRCYAREGGFACLGSSPDTRPSWPPRSILESRRCSLLGRFRPFCRSFGPVFLSVLFPAFYTLTTTTFHNV
jgi:hypothetical protein